MENIKENPRNKYRKAMNEFDLLCSVVFVDLRSDLGSNQSASIWII